MADIETVIEQLVLADTERASDELLGATIAALYDTPELQMLTDKLKEYVSRKDKDIERICEASYQDFVVSVDRVLRIRHDATVLKQQIVSMNDSLQDVGRELLGRETDLFRLRQSQQNMAEASAYLDAIQSILDHVARVNALYDEQRYFAALKAIAKVEEECAPLALRFDMAAQLLERVPAMRHRIRRAVLRDAQTWFEHVREGARPVGRIALDAAPATASSSASAAASADAHFYGDMTSDAAVNPLDDASIRIDFSLIHRALHIHGALGRLAEFETYYMANRRLQLELSMTASFSLAAGQLDALRGFLAELVGFFVIEERVLHATAAYRHGGALADELWELAMERTRAVVTAQLTAVEETRLIAQTKPHFVAFVAALKALRFAAAPLVTLLCVVCARFLEVAAEKAAKRAQKAIRAVESALTVRDDEEKQTIQEIVRFPLPSSNAYPLILPFSPAVVECCGAARDFIDAFYAFLDGFPTGLSEFDDQFRLALEGLFAQSIDGAYTTLLKETDSVSVATRALIDLSYLEDAAEQFERVLAARRYSHRGFHVKLSAPLAFRKSVFDAKNVVCKLLNKQIDAFIGRADIERMQSETESSASMPYMKELVDYLTRVFSDEFSRVPSDVCNLFYISACEHLSESMKAFFAQPRLSQAFFDNVHAHVMVLVAYLSSRPTVDMSGLFSEVMQLLALVRSNRLEEYLDDKLRRQKYPHVRAEFLLDVLLKHREMLTMLKKQDKERKKSIDNVIKVLSRHVQSRKGGKA